MPSLPNYTPPQAVFPPAGRYVFVKKRWSDNWRFFPYLTPLRCTEACGPEVPMAELLYDFGAIQREDQTSFSLYQPFDLNDWYVQIRVSNGVGNKVEPLWTGTIVHQHVQFDSPPQQNPGDGFGLPQILGAVPPPRNSGTQTITAYGIAHILDRIEINKARVKKSSGSGFIPWTPTFNERNTRGRGLFGNRSRSLTDGIYLFSNDGEKWTNRNILRYLIETFAPEEFQFVLTGQHQLLDYLVDYHDFTGKSLWDAMNQLIDRKRGLVFDLKYLSSDVYDIRIASATDISLKYGKIELPANPRRTRFTSPTQYPFTHLVGETPIRFTTADYYDEILVRGERIKVMGNFSVADQTLEEGWPTEIEEEYVSAGDGVDAKQAKRNRSQDKFDAVYSRFVVPKDWDGKTGDGKGGQKTNILVTARNDGTIDENTPSTFFHQGKSFLRETFLQTGHDYNASLPDGEQPAEGEPDLLPMICYVNDRQTGTNHQPTGQFILVDKIAEAEIEGASQSLSVRPLDKELGVAFSGAYRHYLGLQAFDLLVSEDDEDATERPPEFEYDDLIIVAVMEIDERPRVRVARKTQANDQRRILTIEVQGAEYWHLAPDTIVGLDANGKPQKITSERKKFRDDKLKLQAVAAFACAWYGRSRQAVQIPIHGLGKYAELGTMLESLDGVRCGTVITAKHTDFTADDGCGSTVIETGFVALDIVGTALESNFRSRRRGRRLT